MSNKKEDEKKELRYRVVRPWIGGPKQGEIITGDIHPVVLPNVELIREGSETSADKLILKAQEKAVAIVAEAEAKAKQFTDEANEKFHEVRESIAAEKAEAAKILEDAKAEAKKIIDDASKGIRR